MLDSATVSKKPVVAVDLDEVLAQYVRSILEYHNRLYGTQLKFEDFVSFDFSEVWGGTTAQAARKCKEFGEISGYNTLAPVPGALEAIKRLQNHFSFVVVTARSEEVRVQTEAWLAEHYPGIFSNVYFGNHYADPQKFPKRPKSELCRLANAIALIDDSPTYIRDASAVVRLGILFNLNDSYRWSQLPRGTTLPPNCIRCTQWTDVEDALLKLAPAKEADAPSSFHSSVTTHGSASSDVPEMSPDDDTLP